MFRVVATRRYAILDGMETVVPRIHVLSDHVANKIAAGEVVDRPASVLKELMENALDAGATQIDVQVVSGGKKLVAVTDNGHGMTRDDALLSIERHATSKIHDVDDIESVNTLGFRGEALAAIASVSRFSMNTRTADALSGLEMTLTAGKMLDVQEAGCPVGTTIKVRDLFHNVPARRKFLRAEQTESAHIRQVFIVLALSHPDVGMRLTMDERDLYVLPGASTLRDRIRELYSESYLKDLRDVAYERGPVRVSGLVGMPHATRNDRTEQFIFVNRRPAGAPLLSYALNEGYQTLIPKGRYPIVFLFIDLDPSRVDVNVHPTKKEVRFRHPGEVRDAVIEAVRKALAQTSPVSADAPAGAPTSERSMGPKEPQLRIEDLPEFRVFQYPRVPPVPETKPGTPGPPAAFERDRESVPPRESPWSWCRIVGQVGGLYVIMETEDGMVLMDPHAAHERLMYEKFMAELLTHHVKSQGLLTPESLDLSPGDAECVRMNLDALQRMGFGISEFGGDTFIVDALPVCLGNVTAESVLSDVARSLEEGGTRGGTERWAEERIARAACRAAVKARDKLSLQEIEKLVIDLGRAEMPYTCPHGRPTLIFMGYNELDRKFGRI